MTRGEIVFNVFSLVLVAAIVAALYHCTAGGGL